MAATARNDSRSEESIHCESPTNVRVGKAFDDIAQKILPVSGGRISGEGHVLDITFLVQADQSKNRHELLGSRDFALAACYRLSMGHEDKCKWKFLGSRLRFHIAIHRCASGTLILALLGASSKRIQVGILLGLENDKVLAVAEKPAVDGPDGGLKVGAVGGAWGSVSKRKRFLRRENDRSSKLGWGGGDVCRGGGGGGGGGAEQCQQAQEILRRENHRRDELGWGGADVCQQRLSSVSKRRRFWLKNHLRNAMLRSIAVANETSNHADSSPGANCP
ncbi:hypothetical protein B0H13DRAFT_1903301 [Mycena leptocephala]|nr:hypothetical protein B0H13DRAFT_1903301 [Mycena leptocephala]